MMRSQDTPAEGSLFFRIALVEAQIKRETRKEEGGKAEKRRDKAKKMKMVLCVCVYVWFLFVVV